jgi:hypothetical protein
VVGLNEGLGMNPTPFSLHVGDRVLDDLRQRLAHTRWPDEPPGYLIRYTDLSGNQSIHLLVSLIYDISRRQHAHVTERTTAKAHGLTGRKWALCSASSWLRQGKDIPNFTGGPYHREARPVDDVVPSVNGG